MLPSNKSTGRFAFFRQLKADGITCMFGNPGSSEENLLDALTEKEFEDFKYYLALQEGSAVAMADAYARARPDRPAVVQLHSYAGLANGLGMMYYARRGYTPMVVIAGEAGLKYEALDGQMVADLVGMARPFVKSDYNGPCAWRVVHPGSVLRLLRRALKSAATPPRGPVFLALPMDILDEVNTEAIVPSLPVDSRITPDRGVIARAADALIGARRPLIIVGDGIAASAAQNQLVRVAELLGAPVRGANYSEVNMPASHPLFQGSFGHMFGTDSQAVISQADVVLVCGTTILPEVFPALEGVFAPDACVIHFDLNTYEIAKNFPVKIAALADPKPTLQLLGDAIQATITNTQRAEATSRLNQGRSQKQQAWEQQRKTDEQLATQKPMRAPLFMKELADRLQGKDVLIFDEALTHSDELTRYLSQDKPGTFFQTRVGMLGTGLPGAVGLKAAYPDKLVFGFSGDGGSMSTIQALSTAARHSLGAKFVVCNNRSYRILKYNLKRYWTTQDMSAGRVFPESFDLTTPELRFDKLAEAQGVRALRVEAPDEVVPAIEMALEDGKPFLIDLVLDNAL